MPLLFHEPLWPPGEWGLWSIAESEDLLRDTLRLDENEEAQLNTIRGAGRRREFLAARLLLHEMSGRSQRAPLIKDEDGKPHLQDSHYHISISHTQGYSAAVAHPRPCGVDVQGIVPRIRRLARKFVSPEESVHLTQAQEILQMHLIWSAKEAMYKAYGRRRLDFKQHLFVDLSTFGHDREWARARLSTGQVEMEFALKFVIRPELVVVAAVEDPG